MRKACQEGKRRAAVTTLIKEVHAMLRTSKEHKKSPEQTVVRRVVLGQTDRTVAYVCSEASPQEPVERIGVRWASKVLG
jgi:UDP-N-acetylmuramyl tripeptide synthase